MNPEEPYIGKTFTRFTYSSIVINIILLIFLITGSIFYSMEYMTKENPINSELFELAQIIKQTTPRNSLIVATTGGDPTILYLSA